MAELQQYLSILDSDPRNSEALEALAAAMAGGVDASALTEVGKLRAALRERGEIDVVHRLLALEVAAAEAVDDGRRADLLLELGDLCASELLDDEQARECFQQVLALRPEDETAGDALEQMAMERDNWEKFVQKNIDEAAASTDRTLTTHMFLSAARYYGRFQPESPEAESYLRKALEAEPRNRKAALLLERHLRRAGRWQELDDMLAERAAIAATKDERIYALLRRAELAEEQFESLPDAIAMMSQVASMDPAHPRALGVLADAYERLEEWEALVNLYTGALRAKRDRTPESELGILLQIAMLYWRRLSDLDSAEMFFRRIRKADPLHPAALDFYREYYLQKNEGAKLLQVLKQAQKALPDDDTDGKRAFAVEIAEVAEAHLGNPEKAIDAWKGMLRREPDASDARAALKRLYRKTEKWNALLDMMKEEVERLPEDDIDGRVAGLLEVVTIYADQGNDVMVINTYNAILKLTPDNVQALDALADKYKNLGRWNDLISVLSRKAELDQVADAERVEILREIASIWSDRFGNLAQAIKPLEALVELAPSDADAVEQLKNIYTKRRQWRSLITLLDREAEKLALAEQRPRLVEMAKLATERLGDNHLAIEIWNRVLALAADVSAEGAAGDASADVEEPLAALAQLYERDKRYPALAEILSRQCALAADERARIGVLEKLGMLLADRMEAPALAAEAFQEILQLNPNHARSLRTLRELYASAGDYDAMEGLYGSLGQWDELVDAFQLIAERLSDEPAKRALLERNAAIAAAHFQDKPDKVARAYERLLSVDANNLDAARALVPVYEKTQKWARLLSTYEVLLAHAEDDATRLDLHLKIRDLCEHNINSKALAFQWMTKAYQLHPTDGQLLADLERLGGEADQWEQVVQILDNRLNADGLGDEERLTLLRRLGDMVATRLHDPEMAHLYQRQVLELAPEDDHALSQLEDIAAQLSEWADLLDVYRRRVELSESDEEKVDFLFKIARIQEGRLAALDDATATYQRVLQLAPDSRPALSALAKLQEARADWQGLVEVLVRQLDFAESDEERVTLHLRIGGLREDSLDQAEAALDSYREALVAAPENPKVHQALERFLDEAGAGGRSSAAKVPAEKRLEVADMMLPLYQGADDPVRVARAIEVLRTAADEYDLLEYDRRLVELYGERLDDAKRAYQAGLRVLDKEPLDLDIREALFIHSDTLGLHEDLATHLQAALDKTDDDDDPMGRRELATELARLYSDSLQDNTRAEAAWLAVLDLPGGDAEVDAGAYDALDRIYRASGRFTDLRDLLLRREQATVDAEARKTIVLAICDLEEGILDSVDGAIEAWRRVLDLDPAYMRAYKALERLHEQKENYRELEELIGRELDYVEDDGEQIQLIYRRAELRARHLDDASGAVDLLEDVVARRSRHSEARRLLEELMQKRDLRLRIARILEPIYEHDANWRDLCNTLRAQREFADSSHEAAALLSRVARVQETQLGDDRSAFNTWIETFKVEPSEEESRASVKRMASMLGQWADAARAYEEAIQAVDIGDIVLRGELLAELARIYDTHMADTEKAIDAYRRLLDLDPGNPETATPAMDALGRLYEEEGQWRELIDILRRKSDWADEVDTRKRLLARVAEIEENELGNTEVAIATWREVLTEDPEDGPTIDALERLFSAGEKHRDLIEILRRRVELTDEPSQKKLHLRRIAGLYERELSEPSYAISAYLEVLDHLDDDRDALTELSRLYRGESRYADLLDILERRLALSESAEETIALTHDIGVLLHTHLERDAEAIERYAEVLALDSDHTQALSAIEGMVENDYLRRRAAEILEPLYEASASWEKLSKLLLRVAETDDLREQLRCLRTVARLRERELDDKPGAFEVTVRAVKAAITEPDLPELINELARLAVELDRAGDLIDIYRELSPDVYDPELQRRLHLDIADLARAVRKDDELAREYYTRVLDAEPDDKRAMAALESIYRSNQKYAELYDILMRKSELAGDDLDAQAAALSEAATLCSDKLDRVDDAIAAWEQVLEIIPDNKNALSALERLYEDSARWHDLVDLLERRLGFAFTVEEAVTLRYRLGEIHEDKLYDNEAAVENYSAALGGDPMHTRATEALERYLDDPGLRLQAADVLEHIYVGQQDWIKLVRIYEIKLEEADDPDDRLVLTRHIARLYEEHVEDLQKASMWYGRVFREAPGDAGVRDQLARLATLLDNWSDLARVYQSYLDDEMGDTDEVRVVARLLGDIYNDRLGDIGKAMAAYRRVLEGAPEDLDTFERLETMLNKGARWEDLASVYEEAINVSMDDDRRQGLNIRLAVVRENHLEAPALAIEAYRAVLDMNPDHALAVTELERLYEDQALWFELAELFQTRIERTQDPELVVDYRIRLAEVMESKLDDTFSAIDQYEQVLRSSVGWREALAPLERLVVNEEHRERIADLLEPVYRANDWWQKLVVILDAQVEYIEEPARRIEILREIAQLHESRGGDPHLALSALSRAWLEDVRNSEVYDELSALAAKLNAWDTLVETMQKGVAEEYDYDLVASVQTRVAEIHEHHRDDNESAIAAWRRVLEVKDDDAAALSALDRLLAVEGRFAELVGVVQKIADLADGPGIRKVMLHRIAALYEDELAQPESAIAAYKNVLTVDDADPQALDALEQLYRKQEEWNELVEILRSKIALADSPDERRRLQFDAALLYQEKLSDAFEAIALFNAVLEENAEDVEALCKLDELYVQEAMWPEVLDVLDRRAIIENDGRTRADIAFRAAKVVETQLYEAESAIERYAEVLAFWPQHRGARESLDALSQNEQTMEPASEVLERLYRSEGALDALAELYERKLAADNPDVELRKHQYRTLAELYEALQGDLPAAFAVWARALAEFPEDTDIQAELDRLTSIQGNWDELCALLEERLANIMDAELEYRYAFKLAGLYEEALGELERAAEKYRRALDVGTDEMPPLQALDRIYMRAGKYPELAEILVREADATMDEAQQCELLFRLGDVRERALFDIPGAISAYRDVLERAPTHTAARAALERLLPRAEAERAEIIQILEPLYEGEGDHARLADLLTAKLSITVDPIDRSMIYSRIAELAERELRDPVRALDATGGWLAEDPASEVALAQLERLAGANNRWGEVAARLQGIIASADSDTVQRSLLGRLGAVQLDHLGDAEAAEVSFKRLLELDPESVGALTSLQRIYRGRGDVPALADTLWRLAELTYDTQAKRALCVEVAVLREQLDDLDAAVAAWNEIIELDQGDREALDRLALIYERQQEWEKLIETLEQRARYIADVNEERALRTRIAVIYGTTLQRLDEAVSAWQAVLDLVPGAEDALAALEHIHTQREDWYAVQDVLQRRLDMVDAGGAADQRIPILHQLAELSVSKLDSVDEAVVRLYHALDIDNAHAPTYEKLDSYLRKAERWHDLVDVLDRRADVLGTMGDTVGEIRCLAEAADIWEGKLDNPDAAGELLEKILRRDPNSVPALTRLAKIYENAADWERCSEVLQRALGFGPQGRDAAELYYRLGEVSRARDGDAAEAVNHWRHALQMDGTYLPAIQAVEQFARARDEWALVAEMVSRRESLATDEVEKLELRLELAGLYGQRLNQPAQVIPLLEQAAQVAPEDARVLVPLADLYFAADRLDEAAPIYSRLADDAKSKRKMKDVAMYRQRLGGIYERRGDIDGALAAYEEAFRVNPTDVATMAGLGRIYMSREDWEKSRRVFRSMVLQNLDPSVGISKAEVYYNLGIIHVKLDEPRKAKGMFQRGLDLEPDNAQLKQALDSVSGS